MIEILDPPANTRRIAEENLFGIQHAQDMLKTCRVRYKAYYSTTSHVTQCLIQIQ